MFYLPANYKNIITSSIVYKRLFSFKFQTSSFSDKTNSQFKSSKNLVLFKWSRFNLIEADNLSVWNLKIKRYPSSYRNSNWLPLSKNQKLMTIDFV